ncbi:MAG: hypothetical protein AAB564_01010 [Patescibacteria group bacterium]
MDQGYCPYCRKTTNMYLSDKKTITESPEESEDKTIVIIKNYDCQECGCFIFSQQKKIQPEK